MIFNKYIFRLSFSPFLNSRYKWLCLPHRRFYISGFSSEWFRLSCYFLPKRTYWLPFLICHIFTFSKSHGFICGFRVINFSKFTLRIQVFFYSVFENLTSTLGLVRYWSFWGRTNCFNFTTAAMEILYLLEDLEVDGDIDNRHFGLFFYQTVHLLIIKIQQHLIFITINKIT